MMAVADQVNGSANGGKRARILIVEDERIVAEDLSMSLQELGYDVPAILESAEEVIARASKIAPDLILMDVMLGGKLDGVEAAERLAAVADIPVIFLTAHADDATFQRAKRSEPLGYLLKPFDTTQLTHTIEMALYKHALDARLKESENRYRTIFETTGVPTMVVAEDTTILMVNDDLVRQSGYAKEELEGRMSWLQLAPEDERARLLRYHRRRRVDSAGAPTTYESKWIMGGGEIRQIMVAVRMIPGTGQSIVTLTDLTERKMVEGRLIENSEKLENLVRQRTAELEAANEGLLNLNRELERQRAAAEHARFEAEAANRAKSEFLSSMSHELRTPLTAVIGFGEVLRDQHFGHLGEKQVEYVGNIIDSGRHLLEIINDILDLAKIESGSESLDLRRFSLKGFLTACLSLVGERARRNGIILILEMADDAMIEADPRKLKQVMINLLGNALKFTSEGGTITVIVEVRRNTMSLPDPDAGAAQEVVIMVRDTGIGISPEDMPRLFEKFTQFGNSLSRRYEGTGLGLALAKRLVDLHGGTIRVQSKFGFGSTFSVTIPVRQGL